MLPTSVRRRRAGRVAALIVALFAVAPAFAVPNTFTYQGSLKENGTPVTGTHSVELRLVSEDGSTIHWTSGPQSVDIVDGLYRVDIAPSGLDWSTPDLFIETAVNGTTLLPRERITSTFFAQMATELAPDASAAGDLRVSGNLEAPAIAVGVSEPPIAKVSVSERLTGSEPKTHTLLGAGHRVTGSGIHGDRQLWLQQWLSPNAARQFIVGNGFVDGTVTPRANDGPNTRFQAVQFADDHFGFVWNNGGTIDWAASIDPQNGAVGINRSFPAESLHVNGRMLIEGPVAGQLSPSRKNRPALRVRGTDDASAGILAMFQAPWPSAYSHDRWFLQGSIVDGTMRFGIRGDGAMWSNGGYLSSSSRALKEDIVPLNDPLGKIERIKGVSYAWKGDKRNKKTIGFIAEDLEKVLPEAVEDGKYVNYDAVIPVLVESIKALKAEVAGLKTRITSANGPQRPKR